MDKKFGCDSTTLLHRNVTVFFNFTWEKTVCVDEFVIVFYAKLDKISVVDLKDEFNGYLLLKQANLDSNERNMVIGSVGGKHSLQALSTSLRSAYRGNGLPPSSLTSNIDENHRLVPKTKPHSFSGARIASKASEADAVTKNHPLFTPMSVPDRMNML